MGTNQDYKNRALASLKGNWGNAVVATLVNGAVTNGIALIVGGVFLLANLQTIGVLIVNILCLPLYCGLYVYFLSLVRKDDITIVRQFDYVDLRLSVAMIIGSILVFIGTILLILPGIIIAILLSQTLYILKDDNSIGIWAAMNKSSSMMMDHVGEYLWLGLSFIGWIILTICTCGIGFLVLIPYMYTTYAHYYEDLKTEYEQLNAEVESSLY